ncbi:MAG TPA: hypothetical protein VMM13_03300, partial [Euzebya sp.]|nr:hypothetical protein [Euzebya sp.]
MRTLDDIRQAQESFEAQIDGYAAPAAWAVGIATIGPSDSVLDVAYPVVNTDAGRFPAVCIAAAIGHASGSATYRLTPAQLQDAVDRVAPAEGVDVPHPNLGAWRQLVDLVTVPAAGGTRQLVAAFIGDLAHAPTDAIDGYLRLHLLSHR